jgi:hypothetical protein
LFLLQNAKNYLGQGYLQMKYKVSQHMLFWLGFVMGLIQNFNSTSDEKQKCKEGAYKKFWKPELQYWTRETRTIRVFAANSHAL